MKRSLLLALPLLCAQLAYAQSAVPGAISYQGRVADANGVLIGDTAPVNRKVTLRIYEQASATNALYTEEQTVTINKGVFSVLLGQGLQVSGEPRPAIASVFNGSERFLGVTVDDGGPAADPEITPRQQIVSTAYAFTAKSAEVAGSVQQASGTSNMNWLSVNNFTSNGHTKISDNNVLEFGVGKPKSDAAGQIGYQSYSSGLDIVGAGETAAARRITMHAQGGTDFLGSVNFGQRTAQHLNLWGNTFGLGVQNNTLYGRTAGHFAWYNGGTHQDGELNAGGGTNLAVLNTNGLTINTGNIRMNSGGNFIGTLDREGHGVFAQSYGGGHSFGSQDWTTYSRSARNFAWYLGGAHNGSELNAGGGAPLMGLNSSGLNLISGSLSVGGGPVNFGNRLGQHLNLWGQEYGLGIQGATFYNRSGSNYSWYLGGSHNDNANDAGGGQTLSNWNNDRLDFYRRVYIGANPGGIAPLEVNGSSFQGLGNIAEFWNPNNNGAGYNGRQNFSANVSIRASNSVVAHNFVATSDSRLKQIEGRSDGAEDLKTLGALEITNYTMKDKSLDGSRKHKKVIAQQVEKVFPQAVSQTTGVVPDILRLAVAKNGLIAFKDAAQVDLKKGETVRLLSNTGEIVSEVTAIDKKGFKVKEEVTDGDIFVYGRRVSDLRVVEYEALSMLHVSATQELSRLVVQQQEEIRALSEARAALEKELAAAKDANEAQDTRLAAIEKAMDMKTPTSVPAKKESKVASRR
jgi:predicted DNA-binding antitoxin AbrB/MazE fold protein